MKCLKKSEIKTRAYFLWENGGKQSGKDLEYWLEAERSYCKNCSDLHYCAREGVDP